MERIKMNLGRKLGGGSEKDIHVDAGNPKRVIGVYHEESPEKEKESERKVRARFYLTKILHMIFPDQIRDIHASYSDPADVINPRVKTKLSRKLKNIFNDPPVNEVNFFKVMLESSLGVKIDDYVGNFMYDQNDNLVYVDSFNPWKFNVWDQGVGKINFNVEKLREAIEKLDEDKKRKGMVYLERLIQLAKEEGILIVAEQQSKA